MQKYSFYIITFIVASLLLAGCASNNEIKANLGQEFALSINQSAQIEGENLYISFKEVLEDSRCATGATWIWEGRVSIALDIKHNGSPYKMVLVQYGLNNQYASETYETYRLDFKVNPYPILGTEIVKDDYQLFLTVSKR